MSVNDKLVGWIVAFLKEHGHDRDEGASDEEYVKDTLLRTCPENECEHCAMVVCPEKDFLHFHHDGCPSCSPSVKPDEPVFKNCNVCGRELKEATEFAMGMCLICANE